MNNEPRRGVSPLEARIFVIEDNVSNHTTMIKLLAMAGALSANCVSRYSGQGVRQVAAAYDEPFDLILLDLKLPHEDGYEVLEQIRAEPFFRKTLIIAVTGHVNPEEVRKARQAGFDGFLGKPLLPHRFPFQLQRILRGDSVWEPGL
ncbi:MAG: response regulator [Anaerolinea sp.]|nr:response regulator [Anaerolinea sp.]